MSRPIVVVGSGIIGTAVAWQLQTRGADTVLVGDAEPRGASYSSFASLSAFDEPLSEVYALKTLGISHWRRWDKEFGGDIGLKWDGEIRWAETPAAAELLNEKIARAQRRGSSAHAITGFELARRLPQSSPGSVMAASMNPNDGQADPRKAISKLREAFKDAGGKFQVGYGSVRFEGEKIFVQVVDKEIEAARVVIAGGADTQEMLNKMGWEVLMKASPGLLVLTKPTKPVVTGTVYVTPENGPAIHLRQLADGRVVIGERSQEYSTSDPTMDHALRLFRQARKLFPTLSETEIDQFTLEWRPMPRDGMPIIGPLPGFPALYVATGHAGVTIAPAIADLIAKELVDGETEARLEPFRPSRFAERQTLLAAEVEAAFHPSSP
jgi:glycine/D-amino acid oxidase-like deaminating enzyme